VRLRFNTWLLLVVVEQELLTVVEAALVALELPQASLLLLEILTPLRLVLGVLDQ
jgi:hypothetical protein